MREEFQGLYPGHYTLPYASKDIFHMHMDRYIAAYTVIHAAHIHADTRLGHIRSISLRYTTCLYSFT
jgi:hypothetical protein